MGAKVVEIKEESEGEHAETTDYFFEKIGEAIPVTSTKQDDALFDLRSPPSQPLALSQRNVLIFVAHSSGFCVARNKDVIDKAREIEEKGTSSSSSSLQDLSVVDVPIEQGKVHILALSSDDSALAVSVGTFILFFQIHSLLTKDVEPFFSCSLDDSSHVKDLKWTTKLDNSFVALSNHGNLYHGGFHTPLNYIMDDVDAVEWSVKSKYIAVARKTTLSILSSSKFKERLCISLSFKDWIGDSNANCIIKVDSIKWVRPDCIILGCLQLTKDGNEENYLLQVISSKDGKITDVSSELVVQSFYDLFPGLVDAIVPFGSGPYLFMSYLKQCELAIIANRKNTDQHILLLGWSLGDEKSEATAVDIERDNWLPRIELQDNGDDNLIMGLCVDKVSLYGKVKIQLGVEEQEELSPYCILMCLTLEGKLIMFHFASQTGTRVPSLVVSDHSDEEEQQDIPAVVPVGCDLSKLPFGLGEQKKLEQVTLGLQLQDVKNYEVNTVPTKDELKYSCKDNSSMSKLLTNQISLKETANSEVGSLKFPESLKAEGQIKVPVTTLFQITGSQQVQPSGLQSTNFGMSSFIISSQEEHGCVVGDSGKTESQKLSGLESSTASFSGKIPDRPGQSAGQGSLTGTGKIESLPSFHATQLSPQLNFASGKSPNYKLYTSKDEYTSLPQSGMLISEPNLSKQFGNVKEMVKQLDVLLECIEGNGGFKDACTVLQKAPVEALEQGISMLSEKCRDHRSIMDKQLEEIQHLLDRTVQVLARKLYMEGIVKQASESRYWDLWDRQKLNPELGLKRRHILTLHQELTNQLIELERHFNTLELDKFGEDGAGRRGLHKFGPSRKVQSLHSLHNTMSSQLAVAEQLSERLSKQMAVLSLVSPVKQQNVKKELFEAIGIPYDASFNSPDASKVSDTSSLKKLLLSCSAVAKDHSGRQSSAMKSHDSDTARRSRDSLDWSWASFEPPKTIVKRMLLQDSQKARVDSSSLLINRQHFSPPTLEGSPVARLRDHTSPSAFLYSSGNKGIPVTSPQQGSESQSIMFRWANDTTATPHSADMQSAMGTFNVTVVNPTSGISIIENYSSVSINGDKSILQSEMASLSARLPMQRPLLKKSSEISNSVIESLACEPSTAKSSFDFSNNVSQISPPTAVPSVPTNSLIVSNFNVLTRNGQPGEKEPYSAFSTPFSRTQSNSKPNVDPTVLLTSLSLASASLSPMSTSSSAASSSLSSTSTSLPSASLCTIVSSSDSLSLQAPKIVLPLSTLIPVSSASNSAKTELQYPTGDFSSETDMNGTTETVSLRTAPPAGELSLKLKPPVSSAPTIEIQTQLASASQASFTDTATSSSNVASNAQPEQQSAACVFYAAPLSASGSTIAGKNENLDVAVTQEDEMEEAAPETNQTTELSLGSFAAFGIISTPNTTAPKPNPFGNATASPASSSFTVAASSGELFRPASFSFQSTQPSQPSQPTIFGGFSGDFGTGTTVQSPTQSGFGQPSQIGGGQQALGSVLGAFGQSRQLGISSPGSGFASASAFVGGFTRNNSPGGFSSAVTGGGFASVASTGGGFAGLASAGGGFAGAASAAGGFAAAATGGGGFAGAGGFGAFSSQGTGGFSAFGGSAGGTGIPAELFTQMRK
ncbi:hypothetical protein CFOL_v3_13962 [Cephalotus follicularis]|uniref:Nuclear pore complex protein NUP214 n=1 Tax=Cephalotus follicularis TaxID=3775 RepID=A0A1Q3BRH9_CEPFO|nr:hypothetical protein CFOL_v3_13962 [Cephalotus follicularis]